MKNLHLPSGSNRVNLPDLKGGQSIEKKEAEGL